MNHSMNDHQRANKNAVKATIESEAAYERFKQDPTEENRRAYEEAERRWEKAQARRRFEQLESRR